MERDRLKTPLEKQMSKICKEATRGGTERTDERVSTEKERD